MPLPTYMTHCPKCHKIHPQIYIDRQYEDCYCQDCIQEILSQLEGVNVWYKFKTMKERIEQLEQELSELKAKFSLHLDSS